MKALKAILVDDEIEGINTLDFMLSTYCPNVKVIAKFTSSVEALKLIKEKKPDVLFLDIMMPRINGLELLELLGPGHYHTIFTTAHDEFTLQALRLNALDYLKKPIEEQALMDAIERLDQTRQNQKEQIDNALKLLELSKVEEQTMVGIKEGNRIRFVNLFDISHCKSDGNFAQVVLQNNETIYSSYSLGTLDEILPESHFFRLHREYIINGWQLKEYDKSDGGSIVMKNDDRLPISRGRKDEFMQFISRFIYNQKI